jgi:hypothetical protein
MDRLSSCYFCGAALDASLSEYPVVPERFRSDDDDSKTVVLCSTCRRKLATVLEDVVAATDGDAAGKETSFDDTAFEPSDSVAAQEPDGDEATDGSLLENRDQTDQTASAVDEDPLAGSGSDDRDTGASTGQPQPSTAGSDSTTGSSETADDTDPTMTKLEYNKVMRLLQNRQFPVDRAEIREVATSAYDIDPEEFDAVIEAARSRDLIAERNGQFVDPN